ncbi:hypothetical protein [Paenibacillus ihuae]|nr:hypothetical protein [Paenibacillus ihuae]
MREQNPVLQLTLTGSYYIFFTALMRNRFSTTGIANIQRFYPLH